MDRFETQCLWEVKETKRRVRERLPQGWPMRLLKEVTPPSGLQSTETPFKDVALAWSSQLVVCQLELGAQGRVAEGKPRRAVRVA